MNKDKISIIIPTFNNVEFIDETIDSILQSKTIIDYEILIGIDNCDLTKSHFQNKKINDKIKIYFFKTKSNAYIIRNTLSKLSSGNFLLFFDSDDIMLPILIDTVYKTINNYDVIRFKFSKFNQYYDNIKKSLADCQILIKKDIFFGLNGFYPWDIAADSELIRRLKKQNYSIKIIDNVLFKKREHNNNLTVNDKTNHKSPLRNILKLLSQENDGENNPKILTINNDFEIL
jgi:glycosyltransferase involved in cell wall biosynthesis